MTRSRHAPRETTRSVCREGSLCSLYELQWHHRISLLAPAKQTRVKVDDRGRPWVIASANSTELDQI
jgi:hypothetical protein